MKVIGQLILIIALSPPGMVLIGVWFLMNMGQGCC
jgi:hypothetical protein